MKNADTIQYPQLNEESDEPEDGDSLLMLGWGGGEAGYSSEILLEAEVDYVTNEQCSSDYNPLGWDVTDDMLCAAADGTDACVRTGGGPLMLNNDNSDPVLVGIVSFGYLCADPYYPGICSCESLCRLDQQAD